MPTPGVTAAEASDREPGAPHETVDLEGLEGVAGAAGHVAARRDPPGERPLVGADQRVHARAGQGAGPVVAAGARSSGRARRAASRHRSRSRSELARSTELGGPGTERDEVRAGRRDGPWSRSLVARWARSLATHTVAHHGGAHLPWHSERDTRRFRSRRSSCGQVGHRHDCRDERGALDDGARRRCGGHGSARSGRQALAALEAAGPQHVAARAGGHAVTEAVPLGTATVVGLEGALHGVPPRPSGLLWWPSVDAESTSVPVVVGRSRQNDKPGTGSQATLEGADQMRQHRTRATVRNPPGEHVSADASGGASPVFFHTCGRRCGTRPVDQGRSCRWTSRAAVDSVCCGPAGAGVGGRLADHVLRGDPRGPRRRHPA